MTLSSRRTNDGATIRHHSSDHKSSATTLLYFQRAAHQPDRPRESRQDGNTWAVS